MATNYREVCMEIYFNGEFYCGDSCWVPDGENVELECRITDAIYDLIGTDPSAQIHLELQAETDDDISVSYCALDGNVVKLVADEIKTTSVCECGAKELETDVSPLCEGLTDPEGPSAEVSSSAMDAFLEAPEIRPTESTNGWINTIGTFFKRLFRRDPAVPEPVCVTDASIREQTSELDLVDTEQPSVPGPSSSEPEPKLDLADREESCDPVPSVSGLEPDLDLFDSDESCDLVSSIPGLEPDLDLFDSDESYDLGLSVPELEPDFHLFDSDESCDQVLSVPELEPDFHLFDSDESCVPGPSSAVQRPKASTSKQHPCFELEERVKACRLSYKPVTQVWNNIFIGNEETARDRMRMKEMGITHILNAAAMKKKLRIWLGIIWKKDMKDTVNTGAGYYRGMKIRYCGLPTTKTSNISKYFMPAAKFIHRARKNLENKVFIHCTDGVSYAPILFLAYLIIHQNMTVEDAIDYLAKVKYIEPNIDFLMQLAILNVEHK